MNKLKEFYHLIAAYLSARFFSNPSDKIYILGVTGTKGKSTVIELINYILEADGNSTAMVSSVRVKVGDSDRENLTGNTMPGRGFLQKFLYDAVKAKCQYALIEVTSQGVIQGRHKYIDFDAALLTNVHPEHIEAHGSFENYRNAKIKFFKDIAAYPRGKKKGFILNGDDPNTPYFVGAIKSVGYRDKDITFFSANNFKDWNLKMLGEFNRSNVAAAFAFTKYVLGIDESIVRQVAEKFEGVPGRLQFIQKKPFSFVIDYAHTPHSLEAVYKTLRELGPKRMICVLGSAGGGRDTWKRAVLGQMAAKYCDEVILTDEDPYDEDPQEIISEIAEGLQGKKHEEIIQRKDAIRKSLEIAQPGDMVVITGKGNEPFIHLSGGRTIPWHEIDIVRELLKELHLKGQVLVKEADETKDY